jgi:hypothetical protein
MLRDAGFWPLTEPPVFSQHGGMVPPGYSLSMTSSVAIPGQTAAIHYTLDGSDPRLPGGLLNPAASRYTAPVALTELCTVKARARNNLTGEWSPLTEATFAPAAVPASAPTSSSPKSCIIRPIPPLPRKPPILTTPTSSSSCVS